MADGAGTNHVAPAVLIGLAALVLLAAAVRGAEQAPRDPEVVRERLEELRERMEQVRAELAAETRRRDALVGELSDAERRLDRIGSELRDIDRSLKSLRSRLTGLESERDTLLDELASQRDALAASVRSAFLMGREQRLKLLLNQEDVAAAGRAMAYYDYLHRARVARIESVRENLGKLRAVEADIAARREELQSLRDRQAAELAREEQAQDQRHEVLAAIRSRIEDKGETLSVLRRDEQALESLLRSIEEALADIPSRLEIPFAELQGRLSWPVSRAGAVRPEGNGVLIRADAGTAVRAVAPGRVAYSDWLRGYGLLVIVDHGDGYMSLYAYNHSLYRGVGDWVTTGETLGEVGASGGREQAGLYFELRRGGEPIRATAWLAQRPE